MTCLPTIARSFMIIYGGGDKYDMSFDSNTTNHIYFLLETYHGQVLDGVVFVDDVGGVGGSLAGGRLLHQVLGLDACRLHHLLKRHHVLVDTLE